MAETKIVIRGQDKTKKAFSSVNRGLGKLRAGINSTQLKVGLLAGVAGFGAIIKASSKTADALAKTSDKLGLTTEALAGLRAAGELTGISTNTMDMALQRMTRRLSEAAVGTGEAQKAIKELGLDAKQLAALQPDQAFIKISQAMEGVSNQGDKVRLAMKFFDSEGVALVNTLDLQAEGLQKITEETKLFGLAISRVDAAKIEASNDAFTRIGQITSGLGLQLTTKLAPILEAVANKFVDIAKEAGGMGQVVNNVFASILTSVGYVADAFLGLELVWGGLKVAFLAVFTSIPQILNELQQSIVGIINLIPGVDVTPFQALERSALSTAQSLFEAKAELAALVIQGVPSDNFKQWSEEVQAAAQAAAEKVAATKAATGGSGGLGEFGAAGIDGVDPVEAEAEKDNTLLVAKVERQQSRNDILLSLEQDYQRRLMSIEKRAMMQRFSFDKKSSGDKIKTQLSLMTQMTQGVAGNSKKMFKVNKALALANAAVTLPDAVIQTFRNNGGFPWGVAPAALMAATGIAQINAIKSSSFGGGGGAAAISGGGAGGGAPSLAGSGIDAIVGNAPADNRDNGTSGTINITVNGVLTPEIIDDVLVPAIRDGIDNRDVILINGNSRNAQELVLA